MGNSNDSGWHATFLSALSECANVKTACAAAGIGRRTAYDHRKRNAEFAKAWDDALEDAADELEAVAWKRAIEYSDQLLVFMLKAARPDRFKDRSQVESVTFDPTVARDELKQKLARLFAGDAAEAEGKC